VAAAGGTVCPPKIGDRVNFGFISMVIDQRKAIRIGPAISLLKVSGLLKSGQDEPDPLLGAKRFRVFSPCPFAPRLGENQLFFPYAAHAGRAIPRSPERLHLSDQRCGEPMVAWDLGVRLAEGYAANSMLLVLHNYFTAGDRPTGR